MRFFIVLAAVMASGCQYPIPSEQVSQSVNKCWKMGGKEVYLHAGKYGDGPLSEVRCVINGDEVKL